jgi:hypothetical protein
MQQMEFVQFLRQVRQGEYTFQAFNRIARETRWSTYQVLKLRKESRKAEENERQDCLNHEHAVF